MRTYFLLTIMMLLGNQNLYASPITLKCIASTGEKTVDLSIDVEKSKMMWGRTEYNIIHVDDTYISAYQKPRGIVGGEVWVLNRITGEYKRGAVGFFHKSDYKPGDEGSLEAQTFEGHCAKSQF